MAVEVLRQVEGGDALEHRHLHELTLAGPLPVEQGRQDGLGHEVSADLVGDQAGQQARGGVAVRPVEDVGHARGRLDQVVIGRLSGVGARRAIAGAVDVDDVRPDRLDRVVVQRQSLQPLVPHRGGEHVGGLDQPPQRLGRLRLAQVQQHRALVAVDGHVDRAKVVRRAVGHVPRPAHDIAPAAPAAARELHLDHVRAQVRQHLGRIGAEHHTGHVDDADALQRAGGFRGQHVVSRHAQSPELIADANAGLPSRQE